MTSYGTISYCFTLYIRIVEIPNSYKFKISKIGTFPDVRTETVRPFIQTIVYLSNEKLTSKAKLSSVVSTDQWSRKINVHLSLMS